MVTQIHRSALVMRPAEHMFDLVNAVDLYPQRFDWCQSASILSHEPELMVASLALQYRGMNFSFSTRNVLARPESIDLNLEDGPFSKLQGRWQFIPIGEEGCRISLDMDFEFAGKFFGGVMAMGFTHLADKLVDEFVRAAKA